MVKRTTLVGAAVLAVAPSLWSLGAAEQRPAALAVCQLAGIRPAAGMASLLAAPGALFAVVADRETASVQVRELATRSALPSRAEPPILIDRVDIASPLASSFGAHAAAVLDGAVHLLYLDREREDLLLAKHAWRAAGSAAWQLELVEPSGLPVAILAGAEGKPVPVVSAGGQLWARDHAPVAGGAQGEPLGRASPVTGAGGRPAGFVFWDARRGLVLGELSGGRLVTRELPGGRPVHAVCAGVDGALALLTWDPDSRRILLRQPPHGPPTTVTAADGVTALALAPSQAGWVFVFAETRPEPPGRWSSVVCALLPSASGRSRYRKLLLSSGAQPVTAIAMAVADGRLYVLELRDGAVVLGVPIS